MRRGFRPYSFYARTVVPEAPLEQTEAGLVASGEGWFVVNAREARWAQREGRGAAPLFHRVAGRRTTKPSGAESCPSRSSA